MDGVVEWRLDISWKIQLKRPLEPGQKQNFWEDVWIHTEHARPAKARSEFPDPDLKLHHLIDQEIKTWNGELENLSQQKMLTVSWL